MKTLLISALKLLASEINRTHFSKKVREQIEQSKMLLDCAEPNDESKIRSGLVLLQCAVNDISTNVFHSSLYFLGNYRKENICRYNELCYLICDFYRKLGDLEMSNYWCDKMVEMVKPDFSDFDPVNLTNSHCG